MKGDDDSVLRLGRFQFANIVLELVVLDKLVVEIERLQVLVQPVKAAIIQIKFNLRLRCERARRQKLEIPGRIATEHLLKVLHLVQVIHLQISLLEGDVHGCGDGSISHCGDDKFVTVWVLVIGENDEIFRLYSITELVVVQVEGSLFESGDQLVLLFVIRKVAQAVRHIHQHPCEETITHFHSCQSLLLILINSLYLLREYKEF